MPDIILKVRLGIKDTRKNKKMISEFSEWLDNKYLEYGNKFIENVLKGAQVPFEGDIYTRISHSESYDPYIDLRHPKLGKDKKWFLDEIKMQNKSEIWIKLENQWIKGKVFIKGKESNIIVEPENVVIPITTNLFLRW